MAIKVGTTNAKGGGTGSATPSSIEITKTYTIGFTEAQAFLYGNTDAGVGEKAVVYLEGIIGTEQTTTSIQMNQISATSSKTEPALKNAFNGINRKGNALVFGSAIGVTAFNDGSGVKYGIQSFNTSAIKSLGLSMRFMPKPIKITSDEEGTTLAPGCVKIIINSIKILVWNETTSEYETIEFSNYTTPQNNTPRNFVYASTGSIFVSIPSKYILCGVLEFDYEYQLQSGYTQYYISDLTEADLAE